MPIISRESCIRTWVIIVEASRPVLGWLGPLLAICRLLPTALIAMHFFDSIYDGAIAECVFVPAAGPKSPRSIFCGGAALLFIPGATSSHLKFALFACSLYTTITTAKIPCMSYAVMLPAIGGRPMQLQEILQSSVMVWPGILLCRFLESSLAIPPTVPDSWTTLVWFTITSLVCLIPRLYAGMRAQAANGGVMISNRWRAIAVAVFYQFSETFLPYWMQWLFHALQPGAPFPLTLAGLEWCCLSISARTFNFPPATAFAFYHFAEIFIHQVGRRIVNGAKLSPLALHMRDALLWFARSYVALWILRYSYPALLPKIALWSFRGLVALFSLGITALVFWDGSFARDPVPADSSGNFQHSPLKHKDSFRLLRIHPSLLGSRPLKCDMLSIQSPDLILLYYAISYRWEKTLKSGKIFINGQEFPVYANVESILKDMRSPIRPLLVWIDQVCINQEDRAEQAKQVAMMGEIYKGSARVFVCLPCPDIHSYGIFSGLRRNFIFHLTAREKDISRASLMILRLRDSRILQDFSAEEDTKAGHFLAVGDEAHWQSLENLLRHPWFGRVWIIQEIALAKQVSIRYGNVNFSWEYFILAMSTLSRSELKRFPEFLRAHDSTALEPVKVPGIENSLILENLRRWYRRRDLLPLLDTLILSLRFECEQKVDNIFGLMGIIAESDRGRWCNIGYDSSQPIRVFTEVAIELLTQFGLRDQFRVLRFAGIGQPRCLELPSWVPDWSAGLRACTFEHRSAHDVQEWPVPDRSMIVSWLFPPDAHSGLGSPCLKSRGILIDTIKILVDVSAIPMTYEKSFPFRDALSQARQHVKSPYKYTNQDIDEAFWRTIIADTSPHERPAPKVIVKEWERVLTEYDNYRDVATKSKGGAEKAEHYYRFLMALSSEELMFTHLLSTDLSKSISRHGGDVSSVLDRSFDITHFRDPRVTMGRQFAITEKHCMGLVPVLSKVDDVVVFLHGAKTPHLLRPCPRTTHSGRVTYRLVGEVYMHGLMSVILDISNGYPQQEFLLV